ncbi:MAG: D-tyrosyl-tRNA(Tyr) deacylase [Endomicrobium sp.]|nr:D-tyrosyl-tRNA(Tyr) deacylase [Endomicrobium sp.]
MRVVLQRVKKAAVIINSGEKREIGEGLAVLAAFGKNDTPFKCVKMFEKIKSLRIFSNEDGKFDKSLEDIKGSLLIVSQFTLYADCKRGKRPDFTGAALYKDGKILYEEFLNAARASSLNVVTGKFGADMLVELQNDGPVTIILDSDLI